MKFLFPGLCGGLLAITAAARADEHAGPVTDILVIEGKIYSCSQAGVIRGTGDSADLLCRPGFRVLAMEKWKDDKSIPALVLAGGNPGESGDYAIYRIREERVTHHRKLADDLAYGVAVRDATVLLALADGRILESFTDKSDSSRTRAKHTAAARTVRVSPDGKKIASGGMDRVVLLLKEDADEPLAIQDHTGRLDCLAFSPDSTTIASGARDGKVRLHASADGRLVRTYSGLRGEVSALAWGGEPSRLLAGTDTGCIYRLDLENDTAELEAELGDDSPVTALTIGPDGEWIAGTLGKVIRGK